MSNFPALLSAAGSELIPFHVHGSAEVSSPFGDMTIAGITMADGGLIRTAASGARVELAGRDPSQVDCYSAAGTSQIPALFRGVYTGGRQMAVADSGTRDVTSADFALSLSDWKAGDADNIIFSLGPGEGASLLRMTADGKLYMADDTDSYLTHYAADSWGVWMGGTPILYLSAGGVHVPTSLTIASKSVSFGANDSAGAGYRLLRIPNAD